MATGVANSKKLKNTLSELESALSSWDQIVPVAETPAEDSQNSTTARRPASNAVPEEMKRRTRELLNQLKEQIDELSALD